MKICTSDQCYRHFFEARGEDGDGDPDLIGLFAFALVERDRIAWIDHRNRENEAEPSREEIEEWFGSKPISYYDEKLKVAVSRFDGYARGYLEDEIEAARSRAVDAALGGLRGELASTRADLVNAIETSRDASGHWWRGGFQGAFGNAIFAILLILVFAIATRTPDPVSGTMRLFSRIGAAMRSPSSDH